MFSENVTCRQTLLSGHYWWTDVRSLLHFACIIQSKIKPFYRFVLILIRPASQPMCDCTSPQFVAAAPMGSDTDTPNSCPSFHQRHAHIKLHQRTKPIERESPTSISTSPSDPKLQSSHSTILSRSPKTPSPSPQIPTRPTKPAR